MHQQEPQNQINRQHNKRMADNHLAQKNAFKKLFDYGIQIDYKDPKIIKLICQGIPSIYRCKIWPVLVDNVHGITSKLYQMLLKKAAVYIQANQNSVIPERSRIITQLNRIQNDIQRTYPELKTFKKDSQQGQALFNILSAWTVFRQDVGYMQGMSQIAGLLYLQLQRNQLQQLINYCRAFTLFCSIMTNDTLFFYQNMNLDDIQFFQHSFDKRVKKGDQNFYFLLKNNGIQTRTYLLNWILTLFTRTMSLDMVAKLWDILFMFNITPDILLETSYFILQTVKKRNAKQLDPSQINSILKNYKLNNIQAFNVINKIKQSYRVV